MKDRYQVLFDNLKAKNEGAFIPFVMLGDPTIQVSEAVIDTLIANGADALELGIPFSDPVADGPVIQHAGVRALNNGVTPTQCFELLQRVRERYPTLPIGLLVYANLTLQPDLHTFYQRVADAGVDSVLIADLSLDESDAFINAADQAGVAPVFVAPPNADDAVLAQIAQRSKGYVYYLGRVGVTGADKAMHAPEAQRIEFLKAHHAAPIVVGFGISTPEHVRTALKSGTDGAIAGSATVRIIEQHINDVEAMKKALAAFTKEMKDATR
jgi:tryptophan synthase alpha chain